MTRSTPHNHKRVYLVEKGLHYLQGMPGGDDGYTSDYSRMKPRFTMYKYDAYPFRRAADAQNVIRVLNPEHDPKWRIVKFDRITGEVQPICQ